MKVALSEGNLTLAKSLIVGGNVNSKNQNGETALLLAAKKSNLYITEHLLTNCAADVNVVSKTGITPLIYAVQSGNIEIVKVLITHGANVNLTDKAGSSALRKACMTSINYNIIEYLLENGAKVNTFDKNLLSTPITSLLFMGTNDWPGKCKALNQLLTHVKVNGSSNEMDKLIFGKKNTDWYFCKTILANIAKMQALDLPIHESLISFISSNDHYNKYFTKCVRELEKAKKTKLPKSDLNFFNLLMDNECKLSENKDLV